MATNTVEFANHLLAENENLKQRIIALESDAKLSTETLKNADKVVLAAKARFDQICVDNDALREQLESTLKDFSILRQLCGYVEDGSDTTLKIYQDDQTKTWFVQGVSNGYGQSISAALKDASAGIDSTEDIPNV